MNDELLHFSAKPIGRVRNARQTGDADYKPKGLWVSVGESWAEWCLAEQFAVERLRHVTRVALHDAANILRLSSGADLDGFTDSFGADRYPSSLINYVGIRWSRVAELYDGILIAPYVWQRRHELMWYYGWDVASGCIWNAKAIAGTESVALAPAVSLPGDER